MSQKKMYGRPIPYSFIRDGIMFTQYKIAISQKDMSTYKKHLKRRGFYVRVLKFGRDYHVYSGKKPESLTITEKKTMMKMLQMEEYSHRIKKNKK